MEGKDILWFVVFILGLFALNQSYMYSITAEERDELQIALEQGEHCDVFCAEWFPECSIDN